MPDFDDFDFREPSSAPPSEPRLPGRSPLRWAVPVAALVIALIVGYFLLQRREVASTAPVPQSATINPPAAPAAEAPAVVLPPLDESDTLVGEMVRALSRHPGVLAWLTTKGLIRNAVLVTVNIADGNAPASQLRPLKPAGRFGTSEGPGGLSIDPRSYERYNTLTDALGSVDPAGAAQAYATLRPLLDEAHRELGYPDTPFDRTLERAIGRLLDTPVAAERVPLRVRGGLFVFADERLERLSPAQKQLLRFGPRNAQRVQAALRAFADAAGLHPESPR